MVYARYMQLLILYCMLKFYYVCIYLFFHSVIKHSFFTLIITIIPNNLRATPSRLFPLSKRPPSCGT